jgi:arylsulfatase
VAQPSPLPLEEYADTYVGRRAAEYLTAYDRDQPWFCWVSFGGPHEPWDAPEPYASMYDPATMPPPAPVPTGHPSRPCGYFDRLKRPTLEDGDIGAMRANYAGNLTLIDDQIGRILEVIETRGELDNTVIVLCSDHGEMNGDAGLIYKNNFLNGAVRVPLLVRTPDTARAAGGHAKPRQICDQPVEWFDIGPTLVEHAGGQLSHRQFAKSLCPVIADASAHHRDEAVSEIEGEVMLLDRQWKLAVNADGQPYMLFDVANDPREEHNLAGDPRHRELADRLRLRILERLLQSQHEPAAKSA